MLAQTLDQELTALVKKGVVDRRAAQIDACDDLD
jgi:DNA-binding HxlR family transcriptional regulator